MWSVEIRRKPASEYNSDARSIGLDRSASQVARVTDANCNDAAVGLQVSSLLVRVPPRGCLCVSVPCSTCCRKRTLSRAGDVGVCVGCVRTHGQKNASSAQSALSARRHAGVLPSSQVQNRHALTLPGEPNHLSPRPVSLRVLLSRRASDAYSRLLGSPGS